MPAGVTGVPATASVTYTYDAAGHRDSMADGSGSVTYSYNNVGHLTSETRKFADFPTASYPISYTYNLMGELSSVTDPTGAQVNYAYDKTGRVTGVTGTSFGGVTQYLSNVQYRAWGAVESSTTGDGRTTSYSYNSRRQPTDFSVSGLMSKHYDYNADGNLRYSQDLLNNKFDRSYTYDHTGRVTSALSGPAARGLADTTARPYKLDFSYDHLDHLTARSGQIWSTDHTADTGNGAYTNNRNSGWSYDADGRLTGTWETGYTYDAAGRAISVGTTDNIGNETVQAQVFDGDGTRTKLHTDQTIYNVDHTITHRSETQYYVTSSVLGAVVTELDQAGQKARTYVYQGGRVLAWQKKSGATETVGWDHRDPSNASARGLASGEYDPMGGNAKTRAPLVTGPNHDEPLRDLAMPGSGGEAADAQATVDGILMPYVAVRTLIHSDAVAFDMKIPLNTSNPSLIPIYGQFCGGLEGDSISEMNCEYSVTGYTTDAIGIGLQLSQTVPRKEEAKIWVNQFDMKKRLEEALAYEDCNQFLTDVLNILSKNSKGKNEAVTTDVMTLYNMVEKQEHGGIAYNFPMDLEPPVMVYQFEKYEPLEKSKRPTGGSGFTSGSWGNKSMKVWIYRRAIAVNKNFATNLFRMPYHYVETLIHELFHAAGSNAWYEHGEMDAAAREREGNPSVSFDAAMKIHCIPPNRR